jgi:excisionase family DNA binding protein
MVTSVVGNAGAATTGSWPGTCDGTQVCHGDADNGVTMSTVVPAPAAVYSNGVPVSDDEILTVMDVARFLRVPKSTVYKLARVGELPASKIGKHWRFLRRDIHEWLRSRSQSN